MNKGTETFLMLIVIFFVLFATAVPVWWAYNEIAPLFKAPAITYLQAFAVLLLIRSLRGTLVSWKDNKKDDKK